MASGWKMLCLQVLESGLFALAGCLQSLDVSLAAVPWLRRPCVLHRLDTEGVTSQCHRAVGPLVLSSVPGSGCGTSGLCHSSCCCLGLDVLQEGHGAAEGLRLRLPHSIHPTAPSWGQRPPRAAPSPYLLPVPAPAPPPSTAVLPQEQLLGSSLCLLPLVLVLVLLSMA